MITKLNLCDNEITSIPDNVDGMGCELAVFEIRNNKLKVLPSTMSGLTGLKVIDASNNEIDEVQELDLPQLADMNLAKNLLSKLPNMSNLLSLSRLTLSNNKVTLVRTFFFFFSQFHFFIVYLSFFFFIILIYIY